MEGEGTTEDENILRNLESSSSMNPASTSVSCFGCAHGRRRPEEWAALAAAAPTETAPARGEAADGVPGVETQAGVGMAAAARNLALRAIR